MLPVKFSKAKNPVFRRHENRRIKNLEDKQRTAELLKKINHNHNGKDVKGKMAALLATRVNGNGFAHEKYLMRVQGADGDMNLEKFMVALERCGLDGFPDGVCRRLFDSYKVSPEASTIKYRDFVKDIARQQTEGLVVETARGFSQNSISHNTQLHLQRRVEQQKQRAKYGTERGWQQISGNAEQVLLEKIEQRLRSGANTCGLMHAFRKFDLASDKAKIDLAEFKETCRRLGLDGLQDSELERLFRSYDKTGSGYIYFQDFVKGVMMSFSKHNGLPIGEGGTLAGQMELAKKRHQRIQKHTMDQRWVQVKDNLSQLVLEKLEQKTDSVSHQLKRAFRTFDANTPYTRITFDEFKQGMNAIGLGALSEGDLIKFFKKHDQNGDGYIDFQEFVEGVMNSKRPDYPTVNIDDDDEKSVDPHARKPKHRHCRHRRRLNRERNKHERHEQAQKQQQQQQLEMKPQKREQSEPLDDLPTKTKKTLLKPVRSAPLVSLQCKNSVSLKPETLSMDSRRTVTTPIAQTSNFLTYKHPTIATHNPI